MKRSRPINVTGNPNWRFIPRAQTDVGATIRRWQLAYEKAWDEAHIENENANEAERREKIRNIKGAK